MQPSDEIERLTAEAALKDILSDYSESHGEESLRDFLLAQLANCPTQMDMGSVTNLHAWD